MQPLMRTTPEKTCLTCARTLRGRSDKKFCDDYCRNTYNNHLNSSSNNLVRNINNALSRNRRILDTLISEGEEFVSASREQMQHLGFQFRYYTHTYSSNGKVYYYCYDLGYTAIDDHLVQLVRRITVSN